MLTANCKIETWWFYWFNLMTRMFYKCLLIIKILLNFLNDKSSIILVSSVMGISSNHGTFK